MSAKLSELENAPNHIQCLSKCNF